MKRLIMILIALMITVPSFATAQNLNGWNDLSDVQRADVQKFVAEQAARKKASGLSDPEKVDQWVSIGERIGKTIGGVAKEVGVAVNDFVKTPVGQMTMVLIVWNYMGGPLVHIMGGVAIILVGFGFILFMLRRARDVRIAYDPEKTDVFGRARVKEVVRNKLDEGTQGAYLFAAAIVLGAALITTFTF